MTENWRGFAAVAATCLLETLAAAWRKAMRATIGDIFILIFGMWVVMMMSKGTRSRER